MSTATVTYPGITKIKQAEYTQSLGVDPDAVAIRLVPQSSSIAAAGTVTFGYTNQTSITLPNCVLDKARTNINSSGFITSIVLQDRRELWKNKAPVSGRYNMMRNGVRVVATEKTLRELVQLLLQALGESTPDVSNVDNSIYPEVNWDCEHPRLALAALLQQWGYGLALGFGSENVVIHELGVGTSLPTDAVMMNSSGVDASLEPEIVRVCYSPTIIQARFELEAVALDTDGALDLLADVSYKPTAGWEKVEPEKFEQVYQDAVTDKALKQQLATESVYRLYRVKQFSDGDLVLPISGGATLNGIDQTFPLSNRILETVSTDTGQTERDRARVYGVAYLKEHHTGQPYKLPNTDIDDELYLDFTLYGERGLIKFERPIYKMLAGEFKPADLYLECSFSVRDNTTHQYSSYHKDVTFNPSGTGIYPYKWPTQRNEIIVDYNTGHAKNVGANTTNTADLDTLAGLVTSAVAGKLTTVATKTVVYQYPRLSLRLDGLRKQIQHIISDGEEQPGSYSIASEGLEFDAFIRTVADRAIHSDSLKNIDERLQNYVMQKREVEGND